MGRSSGNQISPLTEVKRFRLVSHSKRWADLVNRADDEIAAIPFRRRLKPLGRPPGLEPFDLAYVQVLALSHLAACLQRLKDDGFPPNLRRPAEHFLQATHAITHLRGLMEHEDEYIVGTGKYPGRVWYPSWDGPRRRR